MKFIPALAFALVTSLASPLSIASDCKAPQVPEIPDGRTVTQDKLLAAQANVKDFIADGRIYLNCTKNEEAVAATEAERQDIVVRYNAMVDLMQKTSKAFNRAVGEYGKLQEAKE